MCVVTFFLLALTMLLLLRISQSTKICADDIRVTRSHNDIVSYKKDVKAGIEHNIITVLKKNGYSTQQAMNRAGQLQDDCYRRWYIALAHMPVWGEVVDREVLRYVDASHSFALGDLLWSFQTARYLGATEGYQLHETRMLDLSDLK